MNQTYNIPSYQSIYDALTALSVPLDNIVSVLKGNNYNLDTDFSDGKKSINYDDSIVSNPKGGQPVIKPSSGISSYTTNSTQNIFDVCLMTNGDINKIVLLIIQNPSYFDSINSKVEGVFKVNYNDSDVTDNGFKIAVGKSNINFTTGDKDGIQEGFILQENDYYLLQENGGRLIY